MGLSQDLQVCDGYLPVWLSHHSCVISCYFLMFLFCLYGYYAYTCVCIQLSMLGAQRNQKGGIGFPVELEFQTITTMRVLGIEGARNWTLLLCKSSQCWRLSHTGCGLLYFLLWKRRTSRIWKLWLSSMERGIIENILVQVINKI